MSLWFRSAYWHDSDYKTEFLRFLRDLHGLDLTAWDQAGFWDHDYIPFSFFEDGNLIANVCLYSLPMTIAGEECRVAQLSSVGTIPSRRREGLNRDLTTRALDWAREHDHRFTFLFADGEALPFYDACGFTPTPQHRFSHPLPAVSSIRHPRVPLDPARPADLERIASVAESRTPVSNLLGHRSTKLFLFHALYTLRDCLSYIPDLDLLVASKQHAETLFIHDLVGPAIPSFADLQPWLQAPGITSCEFGFLPDKLGIDAHTEPNDNGDGTHTHGPFPCADTPFRFPYTAHA